MAFRDPGDGLGKRECRAFALGVKRRLLPRVEHVESLLGLAEGAGVFRMHIEAIRTPIDLRGASSPGGPAIPPGLSCGCNARADTSRVALPEHSCSRYELSSQALHSPGQCRGLAFGAYFCLGTLPDQFWVGKFPCAGSAKFAPIP